MTSPSNVAAGCAAPDQSAPLPASVDLEKETVITGVVSNADEQVDLAKDTIAYCRIGERSALTWFVLHELLGVENVKNYDGSWTEYGSLVGVPIELGANK